MPGLSTLFTLRQAQCDNRELMRFYAFSEVSQPKLERHGQERGMMRLSA